MKFRGIKCMVVDSVEDLTKLGYRGFGKQKNKYVYGIRHNDDDYDDPCNVEISVTANRWGFMITDKKLKELNDCKDYLELTNDEKDEILGNRCETQTLLQRKKK